MRRSILSCSPRKRSTPASISATSLLSATAHPLLSREPDRCGSAGAPARPQPEPSPRVRRRGTTVGGVRLTLLGVRGSTPAPGAEFVRYGGHTSCVAVFGDGDTTPRIVLDAGTGLRSLPS